MAKNMLSDGYAWKREESSAEHIVGSPQRIFHMEHTVTFNIRAGGVKCYKNLASGYGEGRRLP